MCRPPTERTTPTSSNNPAKGFTGVFNRKTPTPSAPLVPTPPTLDPKDPWAKGAPDFGNTILSSMRLPSSGLATIESLTSSSVTANAPDLQDPMGELSQRVQRKKAQLSIAK